MCVCVLFHLFGFLFISILYWIPFTPSCHPVWLDLTDTWSKESKYNFLHQDASNLGGVGGKVNYKFSYEKSSTTSDSTSNQQYKSIKLTSQKTLKPHSAATYRIMLTKTRSTVPYTATVIAHFSAELNGFLRWGGGSGGNSKNYHKEWVQSARKDKTRQDKTRQDKTRQDKTRQNVHKTTEQNWDSPHNTVWQKVT